MVHQCQRLTLGVEPCHDLAGVLAELDQLDGHGAPYRLVLFGLVDNSHPAFTQHSRDSVAADPLGMLRGTRQSR